MDINSYIFQKFGIEGLPKYNEPIKLPINRDGFARMLAEFQYTAGAEIGVACGQYTRMILVSNPYLRKMYCVDAYEAYAGYTDYTHQPSIDEMKVAARKLLKDYPCEFIYKYSHEAAGDIEDNALDFVYIDANHTFPFVTQDIDLWKAKVKVDGIISGHDYNRAEVRKAVQYHVDLHDICPWFITCEDDYISWFFVRTEDYYG